ncbi:hyaluronidase-1 isoform X1 [Heterocephalus glaber]|uniref:Hyaluronidase n=1 Tax=Heterocephalus glaber TaxID=10181 RepID=A0AAX6THV6_HETGA|nr:hyaluronidase-1 isoform X1 [Heterocephalus glaber]
MKPFSPEVSPHPPHVITAHLLQICTLFLILLDMTSSRGPVVPNQPFTTIWNADTQRCLKNYSVDVDVSIFDVVANPGQTFHGPNMTIFYSSELGTYPYYTATGEPVFGGLPQNASLSEHLAYTFHDIQAAMPAPDFSGLVVIDWEAWRPRWAFNWDTKDIYRERSQALIQAQHPDWPESRVKTVAKDQFQEAARAWMAGTLQLGQTLRPHGLWGFYGLPDCYNYDFKSPNYTGQCPLGILPENDQLGWLWNQSRALYPSIYIPAALIGTGMTQKYVRHRVGEAFRVARTASNPSLPVLPYIQIFYDTTNHLLPLEELEHTLGESAAQGAAGVVFWVSSEDTNSKVNCGGASSSLGQPGPTLPPLKFWLAAWQCLNALSGPKHGHGVPDAPLPTQESCQAIKEYMDTTLGPFILNVTSGALLCSQALCSGHGRCARHPSHPEALLILNPASFSIQFTPGGKPLTLKGGPSLEDQAQMAMKFRCRCYRGWRGAFCGQPDV